MTRFLFGSSAGGHVATPVTIANGGTGQTSTQAALDALAAASGSLVQGDIFIVDSSTNLVRLARGADDTILKMNGSNPNWEAESGGATTAVQRVVLGSTFNTDSTSLVDVTGMTVTLPDNSGHSFISFIMCMEMNDGTGLIGLRLVDGSTNLNGITMTAQTAEQLEVLTYPYCAANDGQVIKLQAKVNANDVDIIAGAMQSSEISVLNVS